MELLDIIRRAAFGSGVVPTFSRDELPEDVQAVAKSIFVDELLPNINSDRTLDISVTAIEALPNNSIIKLKAPVNDDYTLIGTSIFPLNKLDADVIYAEATRLGYNVSDSSGWPKRQNGSIKPLGMWSADKKFIKFTGDDSWIITDYNIDFRPMRIISVLELSNRVEYKYKYREEFESATFYLDKQVYTIEEKNDGSIDILLHDTNTPKLLLLPVPLTLTPITDMVGDYDYEIKCPDKFNQYIVDLLGVYLAAFYGLSTLQTAQDKCTLSYNRLIKNIPQQIHRQDLTKRIRETLRHTRDIHGGIYGNYTI